MRKYLRATGLVPPERIYTNGGDPSRNQIGVKPVTPQDLKALIAKAKAAGCEKVYFLFATHGADESEGGALLFVGGTGASGANLPGGLSRNLQQVSYDDVVQMLRGLGIMELNVFTGACFSGQLISWLEGYGFTGSVVTVANSEHPGFEFQDGGALLHPSLQAKLTAAADADGKDGVSDKEALDFVLEHYSSRLLQSLDGEIIDTIRYPMPQVEKIPPMRSAASRRRISTCVLQV